jgi:hypothetical protein
VTARFNDEWVWAGLLVALNLLVLAHAALALSAAKAGASGLSTGWNAQAGWWHSQGLPVR